jgi:hypothetical protein
MDTRQRNIADRNKRIEQSQLARANRNKYTPGQIDRAILAHSESKNVPESILAVASTEHPQAMKAAEFNRSGNVLEYMKICLSDPEAHRILRRDSHTINNGEPLPITFFGDDAVMVEPNAGKGKGKYSKAPKGNANGSALAVMAKAHIGAYDSAVINLYSGTWETCPLQHYRRGVRLSDQIISEASHGGEVYRKVLTDIEAKKIPSRMRKRKQRTDGEETAKRIAGAYILCPLEVGSVVYSHDSKLGEPISSLTQDYTKEKLYQITYRDCQTPQDKKMRGSSGWGYDYQGHKGNGRKKENPNYVPQSFTITTLVMKKTAIEALGTTDGLNKITRLAFFEGLVKLEKAELIQPLKAKKFTGIVRFFDHWDQKFEEAKTGDNEEMSRFEDKELFLNSLSLKRDILEENSTVAIERGLRASKIKAYVKVEKRFETVVNWQNRISIPFYITSAGATC